MTAPQLFYPARLPSLLYAGGMVAMFTGQRILEVGYASTVATFLGAALIVAALALRIQRSRSRPASERLPERLLATLYAAGGSGVFFYFINTDLSFFITGHTLAQRSPTLSGILTALWPALWLCGTLPVLFVEMSLGTMARTPLLDYGRVRAALLSGLGTSFALVFCFAISYVASERDMKADLSYFRTARVGDSTKKIARALDQPVQIHLFFPPANEVREEIDSYFTELARESKHIVVSHFDHALHPQKAKEMGVTGNGIIVIARDALKEQIPMGLQLERASGQLRTLDQDVNKRLLGVTRKSRVAYFTQGHDERGPNTTNDTDRRGTIAQLRSLLTDQGFEPRDLSMAQGLGSDVPEDASMVLAVGPRKAFLPEETGAIERYLDRKGRVLVALDPENGGVAGGLMAALTLKYIPVGLANDRIYWRRSYQSSDRANLATGAYSSHASVATLSRLGMRAPIVMVGAGYLEKNEKGAAGIVNLDFSVHAEPSTWNDVNGNFDFNEASETRKAYELVAAVSKRNASAIMPEEEGRAVVMADSDALTDQIMVNAGNMYLALDAIKWLAGEEQTSGAINNEEDVSVAHTRKQDLAWFYSSILVAPALVIGVGIFTTRKRRRGRPRPTTHGAGSAAPGAAP